MVVPRYDPTVRESWGTRARTWSPGYSHSAAGVRCWREGRSSEESLRKAEEGWTAHGKGSEDSSLKLMASVILSTVRRQRQPWRKDRHRPETVALESSCAHHAPARSRIFSGRWSSSFMTLVFPRKREG